MMYQERHYHSTIMRIPASGRPQCMIAEAKRKTPHLPRAAPVAGATSAARGRRGGLGGYEAAVYIAAINEWL
ncbi:hypothetical protein [Dactylosporangium sp. CA-092794]|uniref:hypothetical protein n=1 Tax=Dactylosporangium sp. CA-092794 TaxID=3239929 RepID=UPI003D9091FA